MTRNEIIEQLTPIAQRVFNNDELILVEDLSSETVATWTSMSFMQFLTEIEDNFGFKFKMMEILHLQTIGAIVDTIQLHIN